MSATRYALSIVTYDRGERWDEPSKKKPYHWAFFLQTTSAPGVGNAYQLRGMPGAFYYPGEESGVDLSKSAPKNGELEIGSVSQEDLGKFKAILEAVAVVKDESSKWNCQSWCIAALDKLREAGFISDDHSNNVIQYWLREDQ